MFFINCQINIWGNFVLLNYVHSFLEIWILNTHFRVNKISDAKLFIRLASNQETLVLQSWYFDFTFCRYQSEFDPESSCQIVSVPSGPRSPPTVRVCTLNSASNEKICFRTSSISNTHTVKTDANNAFELKKVIFSVMSVCLSFCSQEVVVPMLSLPVIPLISYRSRGDLLNLFKRLGTPLPKIIALTANMGIPNLVCPPI